MIAVVMVVVVFKSNLINVMLCGIICCVGSG